jgi:TrmH family RNA methyltransferase
VPLVATASQDGAPIDRAPLPQRCAWVLGHEGQGVSDALAARCALVVRIPQPGGQQSLNVAAAAAVCLYESMRRALPEGGGQ